MLVGLAALLGALTVLIPVAVKGYIDLTTALNKAARERAELQKYVEEGFKAAEQGQSETKHLVNSHLDHIMDELRKMTVERDELKEEARDKS